MPEAAIAPETTAAAPETKEPAGTTQSLAAPPSKGAPSTPAANGDAAGSEAVTDTPEVPATWPDDWRSRFAGTDEKAAKQLERMASPDAVYKSYAELQRKLSSGMFKATLPENASEAEVEQFRKSWGIPKTPEAYGLEYPKIEGFEPSEVDKADLGEFAKFAHSQNIPAPHVKGMVQYYANLKALEHSQLREAATAQTINNKAEIKAEYGKDYDYNIRVGNAAMVEALTGARAEALAALPLANGTLLGDHPDFVRYMVKSALAVASDDVMATSEMTAGGGNLDQQYQAALALADINPKEYYGDAHQRKLLALAASKAARTARQNKAA